MDCSSELQNVVAADCENSAIAGLYGEIILIPYGAVDRADSAISDNVISELVLKTGMKASTFSAFDNSPLGAVSLVSGTYRNTFQHDLTLRIFVKTEQIKAFVNNFGNARVIAIVKNKEMGAAGEVMYEAYGWDSGLVLNTLNSDTNMTDGIVYELVTGSDETSKENSIPKSVWAGTLAATETMLQTLTTVA
jgi:hypothetical protein